MPQKQAPNLTAILEWVKANRPDCLGHFEDLTSRSYNPDPRTEALLFLITIGFQAGRQYQIDNPDLDSHCYHTDEAFLKRKPLTSKQIAESRKG